MGLLERWDRHQQEVHENQSKHGVLYKGVSPGARRVMAVSVATSALAIVILVLIVLIG